MRSDLAYAQASLDWAISNFPSLEERLNLWCQNNIKLQIIHTEPETGDDVIIAVEKSPFPLAFSVEVGALLNAMRSALDILAWAIYERNPRCKPGDVYFPIAPSKAIWDSGKGFKGSEFITSLNSPERGIFEALKPYGGEGGNFTLYCLHRLDIARKHRRLLGLAHEPRKLTIIGDFKQTEFTPLNIEEGFIPGGNGETILGLWSKNAAKPKMGYTPDILISDAELGLKGQVLAFMGECSRQTKAIIKIFDY